MHKGQVSFAIAGIIFGFLVGFVVAHEIYVGRGVSGFQHPPIPPGARTGPPLAEGANGATAPQAQAAAPPSAGSPPAGNGAPSMATMQAVQQQLASLKSQLDKNPKDTEALTRLGDMYFDAGMFDKAADYYQKSLDIKPDDIMVMTDLGTSLRRLGQPQKALERFEETVKRDPNHWRGWFNIGVVSLYDLRQFDQAEAAFKKVDELKPGTIDMAELRKEIERVKAGGTGG